MNHWAAWWSRQHYHPAQTDLSAASTANRHPQSKRLPRIKKRLYACLPQSCQPLLDHAIAGRSRCLADLCRLTKLRVSCGSRSILPPAVSPLRRRGRHPADVFRASRPTLFANPSDKRTASDVKPRPFPRGPDRGPASRFSARRIPRRDVRLRRHAVADPPQLAGGDDPHDGRRAGRNRHAANRASNCTRTSKSSSCGSTASKPSTR